MRLLPVFVGALPRAWPLIGHHIARACARPGCDHTELSLLSACLSREAQLVAVLDDHDRPVAAGVTQVRQHRDGSTSCWVLALGGERPGPWPEVIARIEAGAARIGCTTVEFIGRRAWVRVLPDYRAEPCETGIHFSKSLRAA